MKTLATVASFVHRGVTFALVSPSTDLEAELIDFVDEFESVGEGHFVHEDVLAHEGVAAYVAWLERGARGELGQGFSPWNAWWLYDKAQRSIVGICSLRHRLSPFMQERGGHIGYRIRPSRRGEGLGKKLLGELLPLATRRGIDEVMLVCHDDNPASAAVILACGATEYDAVPDGERTLRRFRIDTRRQ